jgi:hypothetical protein
MVKTAVRPEGRYGPIGYADLIVSPKDTREILALAMQKPASEYTLEERINIIRNMQGKWKAYVAYKLAYIREKESELPNKLLDSDVELYSVDNLEDEVIRDATQEMYKRDKKAAEKYFVAKNDLIEIARELYFRLDLDSYRRRKAERVTKNEENLKCTQLKRAKTKRSRLKKNAFYEPRRQTIISSNSVVLPNYAAKLFLKMTEKNAGSEPTEI